MKRLIMALIVCLSSAQANLVNVSQLTSEQMNEIARGEHTDWTVEFSAQSEMPLRFYLMGDLVQLQDNGMMAIKQTIYVRCVEEGILLSTDLEKWYTLLEFVTGNISVALGMDEGSPFMQAGIEANRR